MAHIVLEFSDIWKLSIQKFKNVRCPREDVVADNTPMSYMKKLSFHTFSFHGQFKKLIIY